LCLYSVKNNQDKTQQPASKSNDTSTPIDGRMDVRLLAAAARKEPEPYVADVAPLLSQLLSSE